MEYYRILEVSPSASQEEIKQSFRRLSKLYHPDKNNGNTIYQNRFYQITEAYRIIGNNANRAYYDESFRSKIQNRHSYHSAQQSTVYTSNYDPEIVEFYCNQTFFFVGDEILITWNCNKAEFIQIYPFGYVGTASGQIRYKVKKWEAKELSFELLVRNNQSSVVAKRKIILKNGAEFPISAEEIKNEKDVIYKTALPWGVGFIAPFGRSSRKDYLLRIGVILLFLTASIFKFSGNEHTEKLISLCYVMAIYAFMMCSSRRLHDVGWNGFWTFLTLFPILNIGMTIVLLLFKGNELPNKHGRIPKF